VHDLVPLEWGDGVKVGGWTEANKVDKSDHETRTKGTVESYAAAANTAKAMQKDVDVKGCKGLTIAGRPDSTAERMKGIIKNNGVSNGLRQTFTVPTLLIYRNLVENKGKNQRVFSEQHCLALMVRR